ncbi:hypothetical protein AX774_g6556 [Zancudomyces culisetae]|uniref:Transmembrane protein n=1 Tax=Zancudomyces culisetae TaxID=1213189 RepID=A0A1R1PG94_ZANCU|nr:hypothetical protein AX774_g6556 [Zancudomyces culisetae]|eukprot:OMH80015.1 hypothetical protein AX774_g6556 [Zancudomyces culisetae]
MVKSTLALFTAAVATVSVNAASAPRPRANVGPMQPPMEQVQDFGRYAPPSRPAFNNRFAAPAYRKRADEEEEVAPADDDSAQTVDPSAEGGDAGNGTDDRWWYGYYGYPYYGGYYGYPSYGYGYGYSYPYYGGYSGYYY